MILNPNIKQSKEATLTALIEAYQKLSLAGCDVIIADFNITCYFTLYVKGASYKKAKEIYPELFKLKTAEYRHTIQFNYYDLP